MSALIAKTPVPLAVPFVRGEIVTYENIGEGTSWETRVKQVVNVKALTRMIRYYSLEGAPGVLIPADRLRHAWER